MKITKFGHCCLLVEEKGLRILTDPGSYSTQQDNVKGIDIVLITHEHGDHLHIDSLKKVLVNNPDAKVITNSGVGALLNSEGIKYQLLEHGQSITEKDVLVEAFGVSARTAVGYMDELETEGKVEQVGRTGHSVLYRLK